MLSIEDNERITRTGPGTPMGAVFRRFWMPALLASELEERDGAPLRVQLLGEHLIAFRASDGTVGLLEERCPHRHASLYWGRNEEVGLRCVYHGWKFDTTGQCVDQPAEPEGSRFRDHVRAVAYPTHEAGGIIWAYLGPTEHRPPFPQYEWTLLPTDHYSVHKRLQICNYLQNLEGELDTAHLNFLHRGFGPGEAGAPTAETLRKRFLVAESEFGFIAMARSEDGDDRYYWRMTPFVLPSSTVIPSGIGDFNAWTCAAPIDDTHMWGFTVRWDPAQPVTIPAITMEVDPATFVPRANMANEYLRDRDRQKNVNYTGIEGVRTQDLAVQEDQDGPICRRDEEHLGVTDRAIVGMRRLLLQLASRLEAGEEPPQAKRPEAFCVRSVAASALREIDPVEIWWSGQPDLAVVGTVGSAE